MRTTMVTGVAAFTVVTITALTVINRVLVRAQVQHYEATYTPAEVVMQLPPMQTKKPELIKYKVVYGDTTGIIADKFKTTWERIYDKNPDMKGPTDLKVGQELTIPSADEELTRRPIPTASLASTDSSYTGHGATQPVESPRPVLTELSLGNGYAPGNCTWYVKSKRPDLPNNLGNASSWVSRARAQGYITGAEPRKDAVGQRGNHVVYIESVNADGTVTFSEMNYTRLYAITVRTLPADYFTYIY